MNKVALITGGSRGIGKEIVKTFAENGFSVAFCYKNSTLKAEELEKEIKEKYKVETFSFKCDLLKEQEIEIFVNKVLEKFGQIDVLVNNAGIDYHKEYFEKTAQDFLDIYKVNLIAPFLLSKFVAPIMIKNKYGKIINISSNNATGFSDPITTEYDCSKSALITLTKNMAKQFAPIVNVNAVAPGWVETEMNNDIDEDIKSIECQRILKNRFATPKDIANVVFFLASDKADYINGETIIVDGGMN